MFGKFLKVSAGLIIGALIGTTVASMLVPKSGEEFREDIRNGFDEIRLDYELGRQKKQEDIEADLKRRWGEE